MNEPSASPLSMQIADLREVVRLKAGLLCDGLFPNQVAHDIFQRQNPCGDWKTGNVGIHLGFETGSHVLATISHGFACDSRFRLAVHAGHLVLMEHGKAICQVSEAPMPRWYSTTTDIGDPMPSLFLHEGKGFLHQTYSGCDFYSSGMQCGFCSTGPDWKIATANEVGEVVSRALAENEAYHVCLGGGTRVPIERNVAYFAECARQIRRTNTTVPIWVETVPPDSDEGILQMVEAGVTSFGFNIEVWDDDRRQVLCPAKALVRRERYLSAMEYALSLLGPNRVGSCLVAGLEPIASSIEGCRALAARGVQPCLLPFKPWDGSQCAAAVPCEADDLVRISKAAVSAMKEHGVAPAENQGCLCCEACTIDHEVFVLQDCGGGNAL